MVHDKVGHLGIFVSSSVARKEHAEMATTLKTIEALPPGLYEMVIEEESGHGDDAHFRVSFRERRTADLLALDDGRDDEQDFAAVARCPSSRSRSTTCSSGPRCSASPRCRSPRHCGAPSAAAAATAPVRPQSRHGVRSRRSPARSSGRAQPVAADNPFRQAEALFADLIEQGFDLARDVRNAWYELAFYGLYGSPWMRLHRPDPRFRARAQERRGAQGATRGTALR